MNNIDVSIGIFLVGVLISSFSQILLKQSANKKYNNKIKEYLNFKVIIAYMMFFSATLFSTIAFRVIPLSYGPVLESAGYIFVLILSYLILKERISKKKIQGIIVILIGILIFTLL